MNTPRIFRAGDFWSSNVFGALLGGAGCAVLLTTAMVIVVWGNPSRENILFAIIVALVFMIGALGLFPGNWIVAFPYAVAIVEGEGLEIYAPLKKLYVPIEDLLNVEESLLKGYVVRFNRPRGLLNAFVIHRFFGAQAKPLAQAIEDEILRRSNR